MSTKNDCEKHETKALSQDAVRQCFFVGSEIPIREEELNKIFVIQKN